MCSSVIGLYTCAVVCVYTHTQTRTHRFLGSGREFFHVRNTKPKAKTIWHRSAMNRYLGAMNICCIDRSGWETAAPEFLSPKEKICMTFKTAKIYYYLSFLSVSAILFGILSLCLYKLFSVLCLVACEQVDSRTVLGFVSTHSSQKMPRHFL